VPEPERAPQLYAEVRKAIAKGTIEINTVWRTLPEMPIQKEHRVPTTRYLPSIMGSLFKATDERCGAPSGCRHRGTNPMLKCQLCLEYMHMECVFDVGTPPVDDSSPYFCPIHQLGKERYFVSVSLMGSYITRNPLSLQGKQNHEEISRNL